MNLAASRLTWFQLTKAQVLWEKQREKGNAENTKNCVCNVACGCIAAYVLHNTSMIHYVCSLFYFHSLLCSWSDLQRNCPVRMLYTSFSLRKGWNIRLFRCFQADEEDEWPLSSVQARRHSNQKTGTSSQTNPWLTSKILFRCHLVPPRRRFGTQSGSQGNGGTKRGPT